MPEQDNDPDQNWLDSQLENGWRRQQNGTWRHRVTGEVVRSSPVRNAPTRTPARGGNSGESLSGRVVVRPDGLAELDITAEELINSWQRTEGFNPRRLDDWRTGRPLRDEAVDAATRRQMLSSMGPVGTIADMLMRGFVDAPRGLESRQAIPAEASARNPLPVTTETRATGEDAFLRGNVAPAVGRAAGDASFAPGAVEEEFARRRAYDLYTQENPWYNFGQQDVPLTEGPNPIMVPGWLAPIVRGGTGLGATVGGVLRDPVNLVGGEGAALLTRMLSAAGANVGTDAAAQGIDIASGVQEEYNPLQTALSGALPIPLIGFGEVISRMLGGEATPFFPRQGGNPPQPSGPRAAPETRSSFILPAPTRAAGDEGLSTQPRVEPTPSAVAALTPDQQAAIQAQLRVNGFTGPRQRGYAQAYEAAARAAVNQPRPETPSVLASLDQGAAFPQRGPQDAPPLAARADQAIRQQDQAARQAAVAAVSVRQAAQDPSIRLETDPVTGENRYFQIERTAGSFSFGRRMVPDVDGNLTPETRARARRVATENLSDVERRQETANQVTREQVAPNVTDNEPLRATPIQPVGAQRNEAVEVSGSDWIDDAVRSVVDAEGRQSFVEIVSRPSQSGQVAVRRLEVNEAGNLQRTEFVEVTEVPLRDLRSPFDEGQPARLALPAPARRQAIADTNRAARESGDSTGGPTVVAQSGGTPPPASSFARNLRSQTGVESPDIAARGAEAGRLAWERPDSVPPAVQRAAEDYEAPIDRGRGAGDGTGRATPGDRAVPSPERPARTSSFQTRITPGGPARPAFPSARNNVPPTRAAAPAGPPPAREVPLERPTSPPEAPAEARKGYSGQQREGFPQVSRAPDFANEAIPPVDQSLEGYLSIQPEGARNEGLSGRPTMFVNPTIADEWNRHTGYRGVVEQHPSGTGFAVRREPVAQPVAQRRAGPAPAPPARAEAPPARAEAPTRENLRADFDRVSRKIDETSRDLSSALSAKDDATAETLLSELESLSTQLEDIRVRLERVRSSAAPATNDGLRGRGGEAEKSNASELSTAFVNRPKPEEPQLTEGVTGDPTPLPRDPNNPPVGRFPPFLSQSPKPIDRTGKNLFAWAGQDGTSKPPPPGAAQVRVNQLNDLLTRLRDEDPAVRTKAALEYEGLLDELKAEADRQREIDDTSSPPLLSGIPFLDPRSFLQAGNTRIAASLESQRAFTAALRKLTKAPLSVNEAESLARVTTRNGLRNHPNPVIILVDGTAIRLPYGDLRSAARALGLRADGNGIFDMLNVSGAVVLKPRVVTDAGRPVDILASRTPSEPQQRVIRAFVEGPTRLAHLEKERIAAQPDRLVQQSPFVIVATSGVQSEIRTVDDLPVHYAAADRAYSRPPTPSQTTPEFQTFIEGTVVAENGAPKLVQVRIVEAPSGERTQPAYRPLDPIGSPVDLSTSQPFGRVGIEAASKAPQRDVYVRITNPLEITDPSVTRSTDAMTEHFVARGLMSRQEADAIQKAPGREEGTRRPYATGQSSTTLRPRTDTKEGRLLGWLESHGYDGLSWRHPRTGNTMWAAARAEQVKSNRNVGTFSPATYNVMYSFPGQLFDINMWRTALGINQNPAGNRAASRAAMAQARVARRRASRVLEGYIQRTRGSDPMRSSIAKAFAGSLDRFSPKDVVRVSQNFSDYMTLADSSAMRNISHRYPDVVFSAADAKAMGDPTLENRNVLEWMTDQVGPDIGSGRPVDQAFQREAQQQMNVFGNRIDRTRVASIGKENAWTDEENLAIIDALTGRTPRITRPWLTTAASEIRSAFNDMRDAAEEAGIRIGNIKNYVTRIFDIEKIRSDREGAFGAFTRAYEAGGDARAEAELSATALIDNILYPPNRNIGSWSVVNATGMPNPTRQRHWPAAADSIVENFYSRDITHITAEYGRRMSYAIAYARRFGARNERLNVASQILQRQIPDGDYKMVRSHMDGALGTSQGDAGIEPLRNALAWISTAGLVRLLGRTFVPQLAEAMNIATRENKGALTAMRYLVESVRFSQDWMGQDVRNARSMAEMFGIVGEFARQSLIDSRLQGLGPDSAHAFASNYLNAVGVLYLTDRQRIFAAHVGDRAVRRAVADMIENTKDAGTAREFLSDYGISDANVREVHDMLRAADLLPPDQKLDALAHDTSDGARRYRAAVYDFAAKSVIEPTAADTPRLAKHPFLRIAYAVTSFVHTFSREHTFRIMRRAIRSVGPENLGVRERMALAGTFTAFSAWAAAQILLGDARDAVFSPDATAENTEWERFIRNASRATLSGNWDTVVNLIVSNARYERDPTSLISGAYLGTEINSMMDIGQGLVPYPANPANNPNTNNAEWQAVKEFYLAAGAPLLYGTLAQVSTDILPPFLRAPAAVARGVATAFGTSSQASRNFATTLVGPRTVEPRRRTSQTADPFEQGERDQLRQENRAEREFERAFREGE